MTVQLCYVTLCYKATIAAHFHKSYDRLVMVFVSDAARSHANVGDISSVFKAGIDYNRQT